MNQKIQELIDLQVISVKDVLEYAHNYEWEQMMLIDSHYECSEGTLHSHDEECNCEEYKIRCLEDLYRNAEPEYNDDAGYTEEDRMPERAESPEYIIASTCFKLGETYIFPCDADGKITDYTEYGGLAERFANEDWTDHQKTVQSVMGNVPYRFEKRIETGNNGVYHYLYSKVNPADYWDGESLVAE